MNPNEIFNSQNNDTGFVTLEEIENSFKTPTQYQHFYEQPDLSSQPGNKPSGDFDPKLVDPDGTAFTDFQAVEEEPAPIDPEKARRTGERIARMIDTGIDFTLSNFVAKNGESYKADERDLQDIAEAWGEVSAEHNWNIGPEWTLIILYLMTYGPLVKQAVYDRRMAQIEERLQRLEAENRTVTVQPQQPQTPVNDGTAIPNSSSPANNTAFNYQPG